MMRILWFIVLVLLALALAAGGWWLASQTGLVVINAFGREISLSLPVGIAGLLLLTLLLFLSWNFVIWLVTLPARLKKIRIHSRREKGYDALERALIASASGDTKGARTYAGKVKTLMDRPALSGLLAARSAQADGDVMGAERHFEALLDDKRTRLAALRGLTETALQRHDHDKAIGHATQAFAQDPTAKWAFETLFDAQISARQWFEAQGTLDTGEKKKHLTRLVASRRRAVLLAAEASLAEIEGEPEKARKLAEKAVSAAPDFAPAAALAAKLLVDANKNWRAAGLLEDAWAGAPHPALALAYRDLKEDETIKAQAKRMSGLAQINPDHRESKILLAETALDTNETATARALLEMVTEDEPQISSRLCTVFARLEKAEGNASGANEWMRKSLNAPDEADWSDLDPEGPAFGYRAEDWARLVYSFGDDGELIHPRHERFERITRGGEHLALLGSPMEVEPVPEPEQEPEPEPDAKPVAENVNSFEAEPESAIKADKDETGIPRQPDDPGPKAKADPTDSVLKRKRKVH